MHILEKSFLKRYVQNCLEKWFSLEMGTNRIIQGSEFLSFQAGFEARHSQAVHYGILAHSRLLQKPLKTIRSSILGVIFGIFCILNFHNSLYAASLSVPDQSEPGILFIVETKLASDDVGTSILNFDAATIQFMGVVDPTPDVQAAADGVVEIRNSGGKPRSIGLKFLLVNPASATTLILKVNGRDYSGRVQFMAPDSKKSYHLHLLVLALVLGGIAFYFWRTQKKSVGLMSTRSLFLNFEELEKIRGQYFPDVKGEKDGKDLKDVRDSKDSKDSKGAHYVKDVKDVKDRKTADVASSHSVAGNSLPTTQMPVFPPKAVSPVSPVPSIPSAPSKPETPAQLHKIPAAIVSPSKPRTPLAAPVKTSSRPTMPSGSASDSSDKTEAFFVPSTPAVSVAPVPPPLHNPKPAGAAAPLAPVAPAAPVVPAAPIAPIPHVAPAVSVAPAPPPNPVSANSRATPLTVDPLATHHSPVSPVVSPAVPSISSVSTHAPSVPADVQPQQPSSTSAKKPDKTPPLPKDLPVDSSSPITPNIGEMVTVVKPVYVAKKVLVHVVLVDETGHKFTGKAEAVTIGRRQNNVVILTAAEVSRSHASITFFEGAFLVTPLTENNVTEVNGKKIIRPQVIKSGDTLALGGTPFKVEVLEQV
ncbi:MAG: FHA domain-containing protein [Candidatus Ozemobacteraceae bacterium]